ncbi:MAG: ATP-binding protein [Nocardiopsaceae bacterium]|nr:ATP-binding protein [Nocardiopsaceae bacterium]
MARLAPVPPLPEAAIPPDLMIPAGYEHYFNRTPDRRYYTRRSYEFPGDPVCMPLVHAFLDTCAAARDDEYRYVFDLLGTELATNAIKHSRSGEPGNTFTLKVERSVHGLTLTCRDGGATDGASRDPQDRHFLFAASFAERLTADSGRGLALVDSLATAWGDNGHPSLRQVWFYLAYDLTDSSWPAA